MHVDLKTLLLSGQFGQIAFGISRQSLEEILGTPDDWGSHTEKARAAIWKYGSFEFYFPEKGDGLWMIFTDNLDPLEGSEHLTVNIWKLHHELTVQEAEVLLTQEQIAYTRIEQPKLEATELVMSSGVELRFDADVDGAKSILSCIVLTDKEYLHQKNPVKQISITVPLAVYEKLKQEAVARKKSVSSLCSQWLSDYVNQRTDES